MSKKALIDEIDICLQRTDLTQLDFVYLSSLRHLLLETGWIINALCVMAGFAMSIFIILVFPLAFK